MGKLHLLYFYSKLFIWSRLQSTQCLSLAFSMQSFLEKESKNWHGWGNCPSPLKAKACRLNSGIFCLNYQESKHCFLEGGEFKLRSSSEFCSHIAPVRREPGREWNQHSRNQSYEIERNQVLLTLSETSNLAAPVARLILDLEQPP